MSETRIKTRWVLWNVLGEGKDRSPFDNAKFAYRGVVLYAHEWPVARILRLPDRARYVVLTRPAGWVDHKKMNALLPENGPWLRESIHVDDIGVFSKYPDDLLGEVLLHERVRSLFIAEASWIVEMAETAPASNLVNSGQYYRENGAYLLQAMTKLQEKYYTYGLTFQLGWKDFPPIYAETLRVVLNTRTGKYMSPTEVAKRERKLAREEAKKALGLDP